MSVTAPHPRLVLFAAAVTVAATACSSSAPSSAPSSSAPSSSAPPSSAPPSSVPLSTTHTVAADLAARVDAYFAKDTAGLYSHRSAIVVSVDGKIVLERYQKSTAATRHNVQSLGNAIVMTLVGFAVDDGLLPDLDAPLATLLPGQASTMSVGMKAVTLRALLTETSGLPDGGAFYSAQWKQDRDWLQQVLVTNPGSAGFSIIPDTTGLVLLAVLKQATGRSPLDYARTKLFAPLGIATTPAAEPVFSPAGTAGYAAAGFAWPTDPRGHHLATSLKMTARDLAAMGQLWLDKGRRQGRQLVSADWVTRMQSPLQIVGNEANGAPIGFGYGLFTARLTGHDVFAAVAQDGQLIEVVPDLGLVVAVMSDSPYDPTAPGFGDGSDYDDFVSQALEPAIT